MVSASKHRVSIRLRGYDYATAGAYFVTICAADRRCVFGEVVDDTMRLSEDGRIVAECWHEISAHFPRVVLDAFVVMPNHIHGVIVMTEAVGAQHAAPLPREHKGHVNVAPGSLGAIVRSFKSASTKRINAHLGTPGAFLWQRNYYEHIIRSEDELNRARRYILDNPVKWALDKENPLDAST